MKADLQAAIRQMAMAAGFDLCGFVSKLKPKRADYLQTWLAQGKQAGMDYLAQNRVQRLDPATLFPGACSAISLGILYNHEPNRALEEGRMARYAFGRDYHHWMADQLAALAVKIEAELAPGMQWKRFVDAVPLMERDLGEKAGLGWIGKNTCLINPQIGSYFFLGEIITDLELQPDRDVIIDHCGKCRLCLDICPTQALDPYQIDAGKCLAYQNIELHGERAPDKYVAINEWLVGCDLCQEVCPWNRKVPETKQSSWVAEFESRAILDLKGLLQLTPTGYKKRVFKTAVKRIAFVDFMRNVFLVIANLERQDLLADILFWRERNARFLPVPELDWCLDKLSKHQSQKNLSDQNGAE